MKGIITAVRKDSGFGFLRGEDGQDRFFNSHNVTGGCGFAHFQELEEGQEAEFEPYALPPRAPDQPQQAGKKEHNNLRARKVRVRP